MTAPDFIDATDRVETYLRSLVGDDHLERQQLDLEQEGSDEKSEEQTDNSSPSDDKPQEERDENPILFKLTERNGPNYIVICFPDLQFFEVRSGYNLAEDIFENISEEKALEYFEEQADEETDSEKLRRRATEALLNGTTNQDKRDIIYQLTEIFTDAAVKYEVRQMDGGGISSFETRYKIFPYEDNFGISRLNDKIERVRMATQQGRIYLRYAFQLGVDFQEETAGDATDGYAPTQSDPVSVKNLGPD